MECLHALFLTKIVVLIRLPLHNFKSVAAARDIAMMGCLHFRLTNIRKVLGGVSTSRTFAF